jgi:hypothetical protein
MAGRKAAINLTLLAAFGAFEAYLFISVIWPYIQPELDSQFNNLPNSQHRLSADNPTGLIS